MDALTEALSSSFCVSRELNSTSAPHPRLAQYKSKHSALDQDERRRKFLQEQKEKRLNYVNHARRLAAGDWTGTDSDEDEDEEKEQNNQQQQDEVEDDGMEVEQRRKLPRHYANQENDVSMQKQKENWHFYSVRVKNRRKAVIVFPDSYGKPIN